MIYCADHADAVDQDLAHDASRFVWPMTEVPMYMCFWQALFVGFGQIKIHNLVTYIL